MFRGRIKRSTTIGIAALGLSTGLLLGPLGATPASAKPSNCSAGTIDSWPEGGWAQCRSGNGHFRAEIYCTNDPKSGWGIYRFGNWKLPYETSISNAYCTSDYPYVVATGWDFGNG